MRDLASLVVVTAALFSPLAHAKLHVVATLPSLGAIAKEVGGPDVTVDVLSAATEDPHFVEPKPNLIVKLNQADLLIQNGLDLEIGWLPKLQTQARNPKIMVGGPGVFDASRAVTLLDAPQGRIDRAMGDIHPGGNPHFLFDPRRGAKVALALADKMAALDPAVSDRVHARATAVAAQLEKLAADTRKNIETIPAENRRIVAYHRSLNYLVDWLELEETATLEPKPGIPPDPGHVATVLKRMKATATRVLLQEEFYPKSTSTTVASLAKGKLVVLPGGARFADGETYSTHLQKIATGIIAALRTE